MGQDSSAEPTALTAHLMWARLEPRPFSAELDPITRSHMGSHEMLKAPSLSQETLKLWVISYRSRRYMDQIESIRPSIAAESSWEKTSTTSKSARHSEPKVFVRQETIEACQPRRGTGWIHLWGSGLRAIFSRSSWLNFLQTARPQGVAVPSRAASSPEQRHRNFSFSTPLCGTMSSYSQTNIQIHKLK